MASFFPLFWKFEAPKEKISPFENKLRKTEKTLRYSFKKPNLLKKLPQTENIELLVVLLRSGMRLHRPARMMCRKKRLSGSCRS